MKMMRRKTWAALLLLGMLFLPLQVRAATGYTAGLDKDQQAGVGQKVEVDVTISAGQSGYHAYDLELVYDREKLSFVECTKPDSNTQYWEENGKIRIVGYGETKSGGLTLTFRTLSAGTAEVTLQRARVDDRSGATGRDTPEATLTNKTVSIAILGEYPVTLDDGLTADSLTAKTGENYVFRGKETGNYTYAPTATVGGKTVTVRTNSDGTYYIAGEDILGAVVITANRTAKSYRVSFTGTGATGEATATYNQDYTFTVEEKTGYTYTVKMTIGGEGYSGYRQDEDQFTVPGTDITGNMVITVTYTKSASTSGSTTGSTSSSSSSSTSNKTTTTTSSTSGSRSVTFLGSGASDATGAAKTTANKDYTFVLNRKKGFAYTVTAKAGETVVECTENTETSVFTILAKNITGNLTITIVKEPQPEVTTYLTLDRRYVYLVTFDGELEKDQIPLYGGRAMVETGAYGGYGYLVVSTQEMTEFAQEAKLAMTIGSGETPEKAQYTGDVDRSGKLEKQDAVLVQELYNGRYLLTDVEMVQFLNADLNGDRKLDIRDAAAAVQFCQQEDDT